MTKVVEINRKREAPLSEPALVFKLRWRIKLNNGCFISSGWTPETRYPSLTETLKNFDKQIDTVYIDGINLFSKESLTFVTAPGECLKTLSYKGGFSVTRGNAVIGIEFEDLEGNRYLVLVDGSVVIAKVPGGKAYVANDH